jgi:hypothetical protein
MFQIGLVLLGFGLGVFFTALLEIIRDSRRR